LIKGIIFDLGETLLQLTRPWPVVSREGAEAMTRWYLKKKHIKLDAHRLIDTFLAQRDADEQEAEETQMEILAQESLKKALQAIDAPATAQAVIEPALKIYFAPEEAAFYPLAEAVETVKRLHRQGYRLGLYSNATDDPLVQRLINRNRLRPWLSPTFSSAGWRWRKPRPEPFQLIAQRWGLKPSEMVMVGDTLKADILGAQQSGMWSILVTMNESASNKNYRHIQPTATAGHLAALPDIIRQL
jgi:HAD superfamily hydrolase (TIGR01549 family)